MAVRSTEATRQSAGYFDSKNVSAADFCAFCRDNAPLAIAVAAALFFTYGIKLFYYSFGVDTDMFMANKAMFTESQLSLGRFGAVLTGKFLHIWEFNPYTAFFAAFCMIWFFTLSWCYIIAVFDKNTGRNNKLIPFALVFMTMPVWTESFYFICQAAENAFALSLCPYAVYFLFKGLLDGEKGKIACAIALLAFMISVYQAVLPLFCCGVCACFLLLHEHSGYEPRVYRNLCLKLAAAVLLSVAAYLAADRLVIPAVFRIEHTPYIDNMNNWGKKPFIDNILQIILFGYIITVGHIRQAQDIVIPIILNYAQPETRKIEALINASRSTGNIMLLPIVAAFFVKLNSVIRKKFPRGRRFLYALTGVGVPLCIMALTLAGGNIPPVRSLFALPFATAFMLFFIIRTSAKRTAAAVSVIALSIALYQAEISAQLFYSDQIRFNEDVRLANEFNNMILRAQPDGQKLPVAFVGRYQTDSVFQANFIKGQVIGHSLFEFAYFGPASTTEHALNLMKILGMRFDAPAGEEQFGAALEEATSMPAYPDPACVKRTLDLIVVKVSDRMYD